MTLYKDCLIGYIRGEAVRQGNRGAPVAEARRQRLAQQKVPAEALGQPRPGRERRFTLGLRRDQRYLHRTRGLPLIWRWPRPSAPGWFSHWRQVPSCRYVFQTVRL